ncbi:MAG: M24 family metallopeptidase [Gemmatimonadaceae bacterium]
MLTVAARSEAQGDVGGSTRARGSAVVVAGKPPAFTATRPFGTLREQARLQQQWLQRRIATVLPDLMRKYGADMWVLPMREYNEDPVFWSISSPTTFAARRRTIYVFSYPCATRPVTTPCEAKLEAIALGGTSQGGVFDARRSARRVDAAVAGRQAELWGDQQWQLLKEIVAARNPAVIAIDVSRTFAFADGLSAGEYQAMGEALGTPWTTRFRPAEGLAVDFIASRLPEEEPTYRRMTELAWAIIDTAFSNSVIIPGVTRANDVVWWMRQRVNDLGLTAWFHPSVDVQRMGFSEERLGEDPLIQRGDVLHCDFGITAMRLNTDTQHMGYVLRADETTVPAGLEAALARSNQLQDIVLQELRAGRTGNEILRSSLARMRASGIDGTVYSHPIGTHGHGSGPLIGLWDYQEGVPGRGDAKVIPRQWFSVELQATTPVPEWGGQAVRSAQEEDAMIDDEGVAHWALRRQTRWHLVK